MKKLISLLSVVSILLTLSISVFAGDVPECLLSEDDAKVFIGTVDNVTLKGDISFSSQAEIDTVTVIPTEKIKGDVQIGVKETFTRCDSILTLEKGKEYLFGYIDENNFYIYDIKTRDEKTITLSDSDKYDMTKRLENYLNDGAFAMAEKERSTLGEQISFAEFLYEKSPLSSSSVEKVILRLQDELHEVDKDEFFRIAERIVITNVKNEPLHDIVAKPKQPNPYKTNLYIELLDKNDQLVYFAAVSRLGEVDRYGLFMSRLMAKDYEMEAEDLSKLYSLFPVDIQKEIKSPERLPADKPLELPAVPDKNYTGLIVSGVASVFLIAFFFGYYINRRRK